MYVWHESFRLLWCRLLCLVQQNFHSWLRQLLKHCLSAELSVDVDLFARWHDRDAQVRANVQCCLRDRLHV